MTDDHPDPELEASEAARLRRRDRAAEAKLRELLRPGMGKVFKQILDAQADAAVTPPKRKPRRRSKPG